MSALLAGIGLKDYVYAGLIAVLIAGFGVYTYHERTIGADEALAPVAVLAQKAQVVVAVGTAVATLTEKDNGNAYKAAVAAPVVPLAAGLVCHSAAGSSDVPKAAAGGTAAAGQPAAVAGSAASFDPSGPALQLAHAADAQVTYLQARVRELEAQMESSP
jgi:hypothetical protein